MSASLLHPSGSRPEPLASWDLTIRFSASLPDLQLSVEPSQHATVSTLKQLIRKSLPADLRSRRIRLIHAGKALSEDGLLSSVLKRTISHPPSRTSTPGLYDDNTSIKAKGKEAVRDAAGPSRTYIHCSIGDVVLSVDELAAEAALATKASSPEETSKLNTRPYEQDNASLMAPTPRGFDRLLTAGFTASEVQSLRLQFMDIQAHTHTPDTMPSPNTLRDMEDQWLDSGNMMDGAGNGRGGLSEEDAQAGALDDMLYGAAMGFFWPVGCLFWGMREEGVWSHRRKMAVVLGVALNMGIGLMRYTDP